MRGKTILSLTLLLAAALAGCADSGEEAATQDTETQTDGPTGTQTSTATQDDEGEETGGGSDGSDSNGTALGNATLAADVQNGTAPLTVNFTLDAERAGDDTAWSLDLGDGNATNGTGLPAAVTHTYNATGNLTVVFEAGSGDGAATASLDLSIEAGDEGPAMPEKLHWEFGESLGCAPDAQSTAGEDELGCIGLILGPGSGSGIDGFWLELGELYVGLDFTSTAENERGDSDCFFLDADHHVIGAAHNTSGPCAGTVPPGAAWLYLYGYAEPTLSMTLTFTV